MNTYMHNSPSTITNLYGPESNALSYQSTYDGLTSDMGVSWYGDTRLPTIYDDDEFSRINFFSDEGFNSYDASYLSQIPASTIQNNEDDGNLVAAADANLEDVQNTDILDTGLEQATDLAPEAGEVAAEMGETATTLEDTVSATVPEAMVAQAAAQAIEAGENYAISDKIADATLANQEQYTDALNNGHGIGYQEVAMNQLNEQSRGVAEYSNFSKAATGIFGPTGGLVSSLLGPSNFTSDSTPGTYMANTTGGEQVDAQSASVIDTESG